MSSHLRIVPSTRRPARPLPSDLGPTLAALLALPIGTPALVAAPFLACGRPSSAAPSNVVGGTPCRMTACALC
eukprot:9963487-Heterocapsa_arctica.AAC.1